MSYRFDPDTRAYVARLLWQALPAYYRDKDSPPTGQGELNRFLQVLAAPLAIARQNLRATGLAERMELRSGRGEDLSDRGIFDLAFVPSAFIDAGHLPEILARVHTALRPGGWVLMAVIEPDGTDPSAAALARFRASVWGGEALGVAGGTALLAEAGFARVVPVRQPRGMITFVAAEGGE